MFIAVKIGYAMVIICLLLMTWAIITGASPVAVNGLNKDMNSVESVQYPSCTFNPLCHCSKAVPDLGIVLCRDVPFTRLPSALNTSRIFMLNLQNNGLTFIEPQILYSTGLYRLEISDNPLPDLPDDSLSGLERSLWELALQRDRLTAVPSRAVRYLQKLRLLDLTGNDICQLSHDSFRGLEGSLQTLILSDNSIAMLPPGAFNELRVLETLDLKGNALQTIDAADLPPRLQHLSVADNLLHTIPLAALRTGLRSLDLSYNRLTKLFIDTEDDSEGPQKQKQKQDNRFSLDVLRLDYNQITELPEASFRAFSVVNITFFDGNPITTIHDNAFREAKIRELSFKDCGLTYLSLNVFAGLEQSLHHLDLSSNNLTSLPPGLLANLINLRGLSLRDNKMLIEPTLLERPSIVISITNNNKNIATSVNSKQSSNRKNNNNNNNNGNIRHHNLHKLDISGKDMKMHKDLSELLIKWNNLRELSLGKLQDKKLTSSDLQELSHDVEELNLVNTNLQELKAHSFQYARGVKRLDLSENSIKNIDDETFSEIGHSLDEIRMHRALKMDKLPTRAFSPLTGTQYIDLSGNGLKNIPEGSFYSMRNLRRLRLHDNHIGLIPKGLLQSELHSYLEEVDFSFNSIDRIYADTFSELKSLKEIRLDDNKISGLDRGSFNELLRLQRLEIRGNKITELTPETFQNLPYLEELDLAYNRLQTLDLSALDQVGTLAIFMKLNISHNRIIDLRLMNNNNVMANGQTPNLNINIKIMDLSHNNITDIAPGFFKPVETTITSLMLSHNKLTNATRDAFGNMPHLQWLDLSFNDLKELQFDSFRHTRRLQVLHVEFNTLTEIPTDAFQGLTELRVVNFGHNNLKQLPDGLFYGSNNLENLDVSYNQLTRVPTGIFNQNSIRTITKLNFCHNLIAAIHPTDALNKLKSLAHLDLSHNRLTRLDDTTFTGMPRLTTLDLSYNMLDETALAGPLAGLESTYPLLQLGLAGIGLEILPPLPPLPSLRELNAQENHLTALPSDLAANLTGLRYLDVSNNDLTTIGQDGHGGGLILPQLRTLRLSGNPLNLISDACLAAATRLGELDLRNLSQLTTFEYGALSKMSLLRVIHLGTYHNIKDFNIPRLIRYNHPLKNLYIEVDEQEKDLSEKMLGQQLPIKLSSVHLSGRSLKTISTNILNGIRSPRLHIEFRNTSIEKLQTQFFEQLGRARNLTLDLRNNTLKSLSNPNTADYPNGPRATFLTRIQMSGNRWTCDCELGWVETWQRKKRQYLCTDGDTNKCQYGAEDDLRDSKCENKKNQTLIEILKNDLECGWSSASSLTQSIKLIPLLLISLLYMF